MRIALEAGMVLGTAAASVAVARLVSDLESAGIVRRVRRGLFFNQAAAPRPQAGEAAAMIRSGAVVSLQTVLGDAGVLNNYTDGLVTCLVPTRPNGGAQPYELHFRGGTYWFHPMPAHVLEAGDEDDRTPLSSPWKATPEAALVHWLWLAAAGDMPPPPAELDLEGLDQGRLERLAGALALGEDAAALVEAARAYASDPDVIDNGAGRMGF